MLADNTQNFWQGQRVVVPGGAGFVGSYVVDALVGRGAKVIVVDNLSHGELGRLASSGGSIEWIEEDITSGDFAATIFAGADAVLNLAGVAPGLAPEQDWHEYLERENVRIARAVLRGALAVRVPRLLVVSSSCVYPDDAPVPTPEIPLTNSLPETVNRGYGCAKRIIESEAIEAAATQATTRIAIARPFNVYGARDLFIGKGGHVIPSILGRIHSDETELIVWGSGEQTRSFIHGRDLASGLLAVAETHAAAGPVNIGSSKEISMRSLVQRLMHLSGVSKPVRFDRSKPEGARRKAADTSMFRAIAPGCCIARVDLEEGLAEVAAAFASRVVS